MNEQTATHVRAMAEKIEAHTRHMMVSMSSLVSHTWASNYYETLDEADIERIFNQLPLQWQEIQSVLTDMKPRLKELFEDEAQENQ